MGRPPFATSRPKARSWNRHGPLPRWRESGEKARAPAQGSEKDWALRFGAAKADLLMRGDFPNCTPSAIATASKRLSVEMPNRAGLSMSSFMSCLPGPCRRCGCRPAPPCRRRLVLNQPLAAKSVPSADRTNSPRALKPASFVPSFGKRQRGAPVSSAQFNVSLARREDEHALTIRCEHALFAPGNALVCARVGRWRRPIQSSSIHRRGDWACASA